MWKRMTLVVAVVACSSCVASYRITPNTSLDVSPGLPPGATLLVGLAADGNFGEIDYPGSGKATTREVVRAMSRCAMNVEALQEPGSLEDGKIQARAHGFTHYVHPTILHWEDRATEWSGKRDKISIRLQVVEIEAGQIIDATTLDGKSKWASFGGDPTEELLTKPLTQYASQLCP